MSSLGSDSPAISNQKTPTNQESHIGTIPKIEQDRILLGWGNKCRILNLYFSGPSGPSVLEDLVKVFTVRITEGRPAGKLKLPGAKARVFTGKCCCELVGANTL